MYTFADPTRGPAALGVGRVPILTSWVAGQALTGHFSLSYTDGV